MEKNIPREISVRGVNKDRLRQPPFQVHGAEKVRETGIPSSSVVSEMYYQIPFWGSSRVRRETTGRTIGVDQSCPLKLERKGKF